MPNGQQSSLDLFLVIEDVRLFLGTHGVSASKVPLLCTVIFAFLSDQTKRGSSSLEEMGDVSEAQFLETAFSPDVTESDIRTAYLLWQNYVHQRFEKTPPLPSVFPSSDDLISRYQMALKKKDCSLSTIKNYTADVRHFFDHTQNGDLTDSLTKANVTFYLQRLRKDGLSDSSIERKQTSLRQFFAWAVQKGYITQNPLELTTPVIEKYAFPQQNPSPDQVPQTIYKPKSRYPFTSFAQAIGKTRVGSAAKRLYDDYHALRFTSYLHGALLIVFTIILTFGGFRQFFSNVLQSSAFPTTLTRPSRILSFQARLTDAASTPIVSASNLVFKLWDASTLGNQLWTSGTCSITPDQDGIFSTLLGSTCGTEITSDVFSQNQQVWLEVTVGAETLTPRQQIATVGYALNSETLQGYPASASAMPNTIPVMNNSGVITLGWGASTIQSTLGTFALKGNALSIVTNTGTGGNITLAPDGTGQVSVLGGTTTTDTFTVSNANLTSGNLITGSVGNNGTGYKLLSLQSGSSPTEKFSVDALGNVTEKGYFSAPGATISATYSGATPLIINGTGGQIFSIANNGNIAATGTITGLTGITSSGTITFSNLNTNGGVVWTNGSGTLGTTSAGTGGQCLVSGGGGAPSWTSCSSAASNFWQLNGQVLSPGNSTWDLAIGGTATTSAFQVFASTGGATMSGTLTTSTIQPPTGPLTFNYKSGANTWAPAMTIQPTTGNVGIGTTSPARTLDVAGSINLSNNLYFGATGSFQNYGSDIRIVPSIGNFFITNSANTGVIFSVNASNNRVGINMQTPTVPFQVHGATDSDLVVNNSGLVGIGTTAPVAPLQVSSGYGSNAAFIVNNLNSGDLIAASASGVTKFRVDNSGNVIAVAGTFSGLISANAGITVASGQSTTLTGLNSCTGLTTTAGGVVQCNTNAFANINYWQLDSTGTVISPGISTRDLAIGGTSTASALFQVSGTTGNATSDGTFVFAGTNATNLIAARNMAGITLGDSQTGNIVLNPNGNIGIKNTNPTATLDVTGTASISSTLTMAGAIQPAIGPLTFNYKSGPNAWAAAMTIQSGTGYVGIGNTNPAAQLSVMNTSTTFPTNGIGQFDWSPTSATTTTGDILSINAGANATVGNIFNVKNNASSVFSVGQSQITAALPTQFTSPGDVSMAYDLLFTNLTSSFIKSNAPLYIQAGETFNSSDLTLRTFNSGNVVVDSQQLHALNDLKVDRYATVAASLAVGYTSLPAGVGNGVFSGNVGIGTNAPISLLQVTGGVGSNASLIVNNLNNGDLLTASASGTTRFRVDTNGNAIASSFQDMQNTAYFLDPANVGTSLTTAGMVGIGTISPVAPLHVNAGNGANAAVIINQLNSGDLLTASASGVTKFRVDNSGNIYGAAYTNQGGVFYAGASGQLLANTAGTTGQCLVSGGTGTPTWTSCASAASNYWQLNSNVLSPGTSTWDLAVGGTSTSSALFQVFGTSGNATTSGNLTFAGTNATNLIAARNKAGLTIGDTQTGNIILNGGNVGIGNTNPGALLSLGANNIGSGVPTNTQLWIKGAAGTSPTVPQGRISLGINNNTDYGVYLGSINIDNGVSPMVAVLGTRDATIDSPALYLKSGNVGIGTSAPTALLDVAGTASTSGALTFRGTNPAVINALNGDRLDFQTSPGGDAGLAARMTILNSGNVGIGITAPTMRLDLSSSDGVGLRVGRYELSGPNAAGELYANGNDFRIRSSSGRTTYIDAGGVGGNILLGTQVVNNVGIGTTAPTALLDVAGNASLSGTLAFRTGTGFIQTTANNLLQLGGNTTGNIVLMPNNGNGAIGIGTTSPVAPLQISSGYGSNAALIVNNLNSGDLITASASGVTKFRLQNNGTITDTNYLSCTGVTSDSSGNLACNTNAFADRNFWQLNSEVISPGISTRDLAIGGTATSSALFQVFGTSGNATTSGNLTFAGTNATNLIAARKNAGLTIGDGQTGNVIINPNGNIGIGTTAPSALLTVAGSLTQSGGAVSINDSSSTNTTSIGGGTTSGAITIGGTATQTLNIGNGAGAKTVNLGSSNSISTTTIQSGSNGILMNTANYLSGVSIGTSNVRAPLYISSGFGGNAAFIVDQLNSGDILAASASGTTKFRIANSGNLISVAGANWQPMTDSTSALNIANAAGTSFVTYDTTNSRVGIGTTGPSYDLQIRGANNANSGILVTDIAGHQVSISGSNGVNGLPFVGSLNNFAFTLGSNALERMRIDTTGNVGIGTTAPTAPLHIAGAYGSNAAEIVNQLNSGDIFTASASGTTKFTINNNGNIAATGTITGLTGITSSGTITFTGLNTAGAIVYAQTGGVMAVTAQGTLGQCLVSAGAGTPTWGSCGSGAANYWQLDGTSTVISPINSTWDLAVGGTATSSSKFQVQGLTGNATMSGTLTTSTIQPPTGPLTFNYKSGPNAWAAAMTIQPTTGNVGIGTTNPGYPLSVGSNGFNVDLQGHAAVGGGTIQSVLINLNAPTLGASPLQYGLSSTPTVNSSATIAGAGVYAVANGGSGTFTTTNFTGVYVDGNSKGGGQTVTNNYGIYVSGQSVLSTNDYGMYIGAISSGATLNAGLRITGTTAAANKYGIYNDSVAQNYFAGNIGIGTTAPVAPLHISQGYGSNAALIVNNLNSGDLIAASASGTTVFRLQNNGTITDTNYLSCTGITSDSSGNLACNTNAFANINYWQSNAGVLSPYISSYSLAVGGTATSSALFQVFGTNGNATTSGNLTFGGTSGSNVIAATKMTGLTIGDANTGNILFSPNLNTSNVGIGYTSQPLNKVDIAMNVRTGTHATNAPLYVTGDIGAASAGFEVRHSNGTSGIGLGYNAVYAAGSGANQDLSIMPKGTGQVGIGINSGMDAMLYVNGTAHATGALQLGVLNTVHGILNSANSSYFNVGSGNTGTGNYFRFGALRNGTAGGVDIMNIGDNGNVGLGTISPIAKFQVSGAAGAAGNALAIFNTTDTADILTASVSGVTKFRLQNNGTITDTNYISCTGVTSDSSGNLTCNTNAFANINYWQLNNNVLSPGNSVYDLAIGGTATSSAKFQVFASSGDASMSGNLYIAKGSAIRPADGQLELDYKSGPNAWSPGLVIQPVTGNVGIGVTNPTAKLDIGGSTSTISNTAGDITISAASGNVSLNAGNLINFTQTLGTVGTVGAPTYSFAGDTNTGMYDGGVGLLRLVTGGANRLAIDTNGLVGVGTIAPTALLHVNGGYGSNATLIVNQLNSGDIMAASASGTTRFRVDNNGNAIASSFQDLQNTSYFLDPANVGTSLALAGNAGIGTTSPISQLNITGATAGKSQVIFNETGDQNILTASSSGTAVFQVGHDGDLTIGSTAKPAVTASLYGDILQKENISFTGITGITGTYVYDTAKDSDFGAWTDNTAARASSWYTETKGDGPGVSCNISTMTRCGTSYFPRKAVIVTTSANGWYIFDAVSNKMWMHGNTGIGWKDCGGSYTSAAMLNGILYLGNRNDAGSCGMIRVLDFKKDFGYFIKDNGSQYTTGAPSSIATRNSGGTGSVFINTAITPLLSYGTTGFGPAIDDLHVNVVQGKTYLIAAIGQNTLADNNEGFSLMNMTDGKTTQFVLDSQSADDIRPKRVWLTSSGNAYLAHFDATTTTDVVREYTSIQNDASEASFAQLQTYGWNSTTTNPMLLPNTTESTGALWVTEGTSHADGFSDTIYFGGAAGMTVIQDFQGYASSQSSVKYYTKDYITEELYAGVRGMWPLSDRTGAISMTDVSGLGNTLTNNNGVTAVPGVRGMAASFNGTNQTLSCTDAACGGTTKTDWGGSAWMIGAWVKTTATNGYIMSKGTTADFSYGLQMSGAKAYISFWQAAGSVWAQVGSTTSINDGNWHYVVGTYTGGQQPLRVRIYVDGNLEGTTTTFTGTADTNSAAAFVIGGRADAAAGTYWTGQIDQPFISTQQDPTLEQIRYMYESGRKALQHQSIASTAVSSATANSLTNTLQTWIPQQFVGSYVEIMSGTGAGQTRMVASNSATLISVSPNFTTTPDATSTFAIHPQTLYGTSNVVRGIAVTDDPTTNNVYAYVGTNSGSGLGGVSKIDLGGDTIMDVWHNNAGKSDQGGTAWSTTSGYNDITAIGAASKTVAFGSSSHYWQERTELSMMSELDAIRAKVSTSGQPGSGNTSTPVSLNTRIGQAGSESTYFSGSYQVIRKGWGWGLPAGATALTVGVTYGITYDEIPMVYLNYLGGQSPSTSYVPTSSILQCAGSASWWITTIHAFAGSPTTTGFTASFGNNGTAFGASDYLCYDWMAIGPYRAGYTPGGQNFAGGADLAEWYNTDDPTLKAGEVVAIAKTGDIKVERTSSSNKNAAMGIISTRPATILGDKSGLTPGYKEDQFKSGAQSVAVALAGRVPVKVSLENGPVKAGDYLAPANTPGYVVKAITAGPVVGKSMEDWDGHTTISNVVTSEATKSADLKAPPVDDADFKELQAGHGIIMAFVQNGYWDPDTGFSAGQLASNYAIEKNTATDSAILAVLPYQLRNTVIGQLIDKAFSATNAMIANLTAGAIKAEEIATNNLKIGGVSIKDLIAQVVDQKLSSGDLSLGTYASRQTLADHENLTFKLGSPDASGSGRNTFTIANRYSTPVAVIDEQGNASFSGTLTAKSGTFDNLTISDASISGVLYASQIAGLREKVAAMINDRLASSSSHPSVAFGEGGSYKSYDSYPSDLSATPSADLVASLTDTNSEILARLASLEAKASTATNSGFLASTSLTGISVSSVLSDELIAHSALSVGSTILVDATGINSAADTLSIQGSGHGQINLLAGAMTLDSSGLVVNTDAFFAKSVTIKEDLMVNLIKSMNGDIQIRLATPSSKLSDHLAILNKQEQEVATIDASGSAKFNKLIIASDREDPSRTATISGQYRTNASTGDATLPAGTKSLKIVSPKVGFASLVYVTPTSSTNNQVLYVSSKHIADPLVPGDISYFVISIDNPIAIPVTFNWWIIN